MSRTIQRKECSGGLDGGDYESMMRLLLPRKFMFDRALRRSFVDGTHIGLLHTPRFGVLRTIAFEGFIHAITVYASEFMTRTNLLQKSRYNISRDGVDLCVSYSLCYLFRIFRDRIQNIVHKYFDEDNDAVSISIRESHKTFSMTHPDHPGLFASSSYIK